VCDFIRNSLHEGQKEFTSSYGKKSRRAAECATSPSQSWPHYPIEIGITAKSGIFTSSFDGRERLRVNCAYTAPKPIVEFANQGTSHVS